METRHLTAHQKESLVTVMIVILGVLVTVGQIAETGSGLLWDMLNYLSLYIDPLQYMVGMLMINFILVLTAIKRHQACPNPVLNSLKWYFTVLYLNDFIILVLRVIQKSNMVLYRGSLTMGPGKTYLVLAAVRGMVDITLTAAAMCLLVRALSRYAPSPGTEKKGDFRLERAVLGLLAVQWLSSIPINLTGFLNSRALFAWALGLSQSCHILVIACLFWMVKEHYQKYRSRFFNYLTAYYLIALGAAGLVFTYSMGSFGLLQRFPAGETGMMTGFGQFVFLVSRVAAIVMNYYMFRAVAGYAERPVPAAAGIIASVPHE